MADRGHMDISAHRETYTDFLKFAKWTTIIIIGTLIVLAATVA